MYRFLKFILMFVTSLTIISCDNPLEDKVNDLENQLNEQKQDNIRQQEMLDSLMHVLSTQQIQLNLVATERQRIIDSLSLLFDGKLDSLDSEQKTLIDSLKLEQTKYVDSLYSYQQNMIQYIMDNQVNGKFSDEEVFNGDCPTEWTDLDVSNIVGTKKTLLVFRLDKLSSKGTAVIFRPNGETKDWLTDNPNFFDASTSSLSFIDVGIGNSGLVMIYTDDAGIVEMRANRSRDYEVPIITISLKLEYYLN